MSPVRSPMRAVQLRLRPFGEATRHSHMDIDQ